MIHIFSLNLFIFGLTSWYDYDIACTYFNDIFKQINKVGVRARGYGV
jgi:hypothetical protein